jgi:hypothetical protein
MSDPQQPQNFQWPQQGGQPQPGGQAWPGAQPQPGGQAWPGAQPQPGGQPWAGGQPGAQPWQAQPQTGFPPGYGQPVRRPRRWLAPVIVVVALIAAGIGGFVAFHNASSKSKGTITLPGTLLNLPRNTSTSAAGLARVLSKGESTNSHGRLKNVKAGVYGSPNAAWLAIAGGGICGTCFAKSPSALETGLTNSGYSNVRSYPAGPKGGSLACGEKTANTTTLLHCAWVDKSTAGDVLFAGGAASNLADAAAKTNQVRAAIEH